MAWWENRRTTFLTNQSARIAEDGDVALLPGREAGVRQIAGRDYDPSNDMLGLIHQDGGAAPFQLSVFPERVALVRIPPERNERRFHRLVLRPDLGSVFDALADLGHAKRRRGYRDQATLPW